MFQESLDAPGRSDLGEIEGAEVDGPLLPDRRSAVLRSTYFIGQRFAFNQLAPLQLVDYFTDLLLR